MCIGRFVEKARNPNGTSSFIYIYTKKTTLYGFGPLSVAAFVSSFRYAFGSSFRLLMKPSHMVQNSPLGTVLPLSSTPVFSQFVRASFAMSPQLAWPALE